MTATHRRRCDASRGGMSAMKQCSVEVFNPSRFRNRRGAGSRGRKGSGAGEFFPQWWGEARPLMGRNARRVVWSDAGLI